MVEGAVKIIYQTIYTKVRDRDFHSLRELNEAIWHALENTERYIIAVLSLRKHPEQAYKSCQGILSFAARAGNERLEAACRRANFYQD